MPRNYIKKLGKYGKCNYDPVYLANAIKDVKNRKLSIRKASEVYGVPFSTLREHVLGKHTKTYGGQCVLNIEDEQYLVTCLSKCSEWGFPLKRADIRNLVQNYLNRSGRKEKRFKNNRPGKDWFVKFMNRHPELTERMGQNVKRVRAGVTRETLKEFYDNLEDTLRGISPSNIVNYDETNFTDDPGEMKVVVKRGVKHADRIIDTSKSSISVMVAASADGHVFPPYTVYKAKYLYPTWTEGGIPEAGYNRNQSGWFDLEMFEDWFEKILLPSLRKLDGKKAIIGDNLSSHLSVNVVRLCEANDIKFILLPPNATHLCQPLDVAFFKPLKSAWRTVLENWKQKNRGVLPKSEFPALLQKAFEKVGVNCAANVQAGFRACGIFPLDGERVLRKVLPQMDPTPVAEGWCSTLIDHLKATRTSETRTNKARGKKLDLPPGKGVVVKDLNDSDEEDMVVDGGEDTCGSSNSSEKMNSDTEDSESEEVPVLPQSDSEEDINFEINDFVVTKFTTEEDNRCRLYLGKIMEIGISECNISFLRKKIGAKETYFYFPEVPDICKCKKNIIKKVKCADIRRGRIALKNASKTLLDKLN